MNELNVEFETECELNETNMEISTEISEEITQADSEIITQSEMEVSTSNSQTLSQIDILTSINMYISIICIVVVVWFCAWLMRSWRTWTSKSGRRI